MEMNFCRRCAAPLTHKSDHIYRCSNGHTLYANAAPAVGIFFITPDNELILSVRGIEPNKGMLDAFGGFLDGKETLEEGAARELREELSLEPHEYEPLQYLTSGIDTYEYQKESVPFVTASFWTRLKTDRALNPSDDVAAIKVVPLHGIDPLTLHADDVRKGVEELQHIFPQ